MVHKIYSSKNQLTAARRMSTVVLFSASSYSTIRHFIQLQSNLHSTIQPIFNFISTHYPSIQSYSSPI